MNAACARRAGIFFYHTAGARPYSARGTSSTCIKETIINGKIVMSDGKVNIKGTGQPLNF